MTYLVISNYGTNRMTIIGATKDITLCVELARNFTSRFNEREFINRFNTTLINEFCPFHIGNIYGVIGVTELNLSA